MPDIYHSLLGRDLGHLRIVAELWGIELKSAEVNERAKEQCIHPTVDGVIEN